MGYNLQTVGIDEKLNINSDNILQINFYDFVICTRLDNCDFVLAINGEFIGQSNSCSYTYSKNMLTDTIISYKFQDNLQAPSKII